MYSFLNPITPTEIISIVSKLRNNKSCGHDDVSVRLLKKVVRIISCPLSALFNISLSTGIAPDQFNLQRLFLFLRMVLMKIFLIIGPISILPVFSKILERVVYNRLFMFLNKCNTITERQHSFRPGHSTSNAIMHFILVF